MSSQSAFYGRFRRNIFVLFRFEVYLTNHSSVQFSYWNVPAFLHFPGYSMSFRSEMHRYTSLRTVISYARSDTFHFSAISETERYFIRSSPIILQIKFGVVSISYIRQKLYFGNLPYKYFLPFKYSCILNKRSPYPTGGLRIHLLSFTIRFSIGYFSNL